MFCNTVTNFNSVILGGNYQLNSSLGGIIGGGILHTVSNGAANAIFSGGENFVTAADGFSVIAGGAQNKVDGGYSSVLGGFRNEVNGAHSAILGGCGNLVPNTRAYAGIFGCAVTAVTDCAMHSNTFVAQNMCDMTSGGLLPPTGTFYYCIISGEKHLFMA